MRFIIKHIITLIKKSIGKKKEIENIYLMSLKRRLKSEKILIKLELSPNIPITIKNAKRKNSNNTNIKKFKHLITNIIYKLMSNTCFTGFVNLRIISLNLN